MANISNNTADTLVIGTSGSDTVANYARNVTINTGAQDDYIRNYYQAKNVSILGGTGSDSIKNTGSESTIQGGAGHDTIINTNEGNAHTLGGCYSLVDGGSEDDYIENYYYCEWSTLMGGAGDDTICNISFSLEIFGGSGNDSIKNFRMNTLIEGGAGDDTISNAKEHDEKSNDTILGGAGNDSIRNTGDWVSIGAGDGNDTIINTCAGNNITAAGSYSSIDGGAGDDYIENLPYCNAVSINGSAGNDTIKNGNSAGGVHDETINGGDGDDVIYNMWGKRNSMDGGAGNDYIENKRTGGEGQDVTITGGAGKDTIVNEASAVTIDGGAGNDALGIDPGQSAIAVEDVTLTGGAGNDSFFFSSYGSNTLSAVITDFTGKDVLVYDGDYEETSDKKLTCNVENGNLVIRNDRTADGEQIAATFSVTLEGVDSLEQISSAKIHRARYWTASDLTGTEVSDTTFGELFGGRVINIITNEKSSKKINGTSGADSISNSGTRVTIRGGKGNDYIDNWNSNVSIDGGAADDEIYNAGSDVTISGGKGNDYIDSGGTNVVFNYAAGDGDDSILGFGENDTLKISGTYSSKKSGVDVIVTVGKGKITLVGAASLSKVKIKGNKASGDSWKLNGTTATYGSLVVKGVTSLDGLSLNGKILTVSAASLGTEKISVSDGYTLALGDDVKASTTKKSWTLKNSTASYKQTTTAGYELDDNEIIYSKKSSKTLATVTGVKSLDGLSVSKKIVTVSAASLGTEKISVSDGYTLALGSDVSSSTTKKSWTLKNSTATYKQTTTAGYKLDGNEIIYSKKSSKTLATVKGVTSTDGLNVSGKTIKLSGDALNKKVSVSGGYTFDFASGYSKASITGSSSSDTIIARGKNISISGGAGSDIFALKPTVANVISDYDSADKISLLSGAADFSVSGSDVIINEKITVAGAAEKIVTYIEDGAEKIFAAPAPYNEAVTLAANYAEDTFTANATLVTIDASAVLQPLEIFGNKKANVITGSDEDDYIDGGTGADKIFGRDGNDTLIGGKGNDSLSGGKGDDSLWGGAGTDTLRGGDGSDIFVYKAGDGKIIVEDFDDAWDKIRVLSGSVDVPESDGKDVTFAVDDGQIIIKGGASKYIPIYLGEGNKNIVQKYIPRS